MTLAQAAAYRLFAGGGDPKRSLVWRALVFITGLASIAALLSHATPSLATLGAYPTTCLAFAIVGILVSLVYTGMAYIQQAMTHRLQPFFYIPVRSVVLRRLLWAAYLPAITVSIVLAGSLLWGLFGMSRHWVYAVLAGGSALAVSIVFHTMIRITRTILQPGARLISLAVVMGLTWSAWEVMQHSYDQAAYVIASCALGMTAVSLKLFKAPLLTVHAQSIHRVREWRSMRFIQSVIVRSFRSSRYVGANIFLLLLLAVLIGMAWREPALPFDAVCLLVLLLAGTLGQEARSLSRAQYPLEMLWFGRQGPWLASLWLLAFVNAAFFTDLLLSIAIVWFSHGVSIDYMQVAGVGLSLVGAAFVAASIVVPRTDDILAQLSSTALYGILSWIILHSTANMTLVSALGVFLASIAGCLALSYWVERIRWALTTRGKYGIFHTR